MYIGNHGYDNEVSSLSNRKYRLEFEVEVIRKLTFRVVSALLDAAAVLWLRNGFEEKFQHQSIRDDQPVQPDVQTAGHRGVAEQWHAFHNRTSAYLED